MALVTIVGYPCSGKTRLVNALEAYIKSKVAEEGYGGPSYSVVVVSDDNSHVPRSTYDSEWFGVQAFVLEHVAAIRRLRAPGKLRRTSVMILH